MCLLADNHAAGSLVFTNLGRPSVKPMEAPYHGPSEPLFLQFKLPAKTRGRNIENMPQVSLKMQQLFFFVLLCL